MGPFRYGIIGFMRYVVHRGHEVHVVYGALGAWDHVWSYDSLGFMGNVSMDLHGAHECHDVHGIIGLWRLWAPWGYGG